MNKIQTTIHRFIAKLTANSSAKNQIFFIKKLSFLIQADIPLLQALSILAEQSEGNRIKTTIEDISKNIAGGQSLARSLSKKPGFLSEFSIQIIKIGEYSGTLSENLEYLAKELEKREMLKKKIVGACVYPVVVCVATLGITTFLILYLFPKILPVFQSLRIALPLSTRILMVVSKAVTSYWLYMLVGVILIFLGLLIVLRKFPKFLFYFHTILIRVPLFGSVFKSYFLTQITRTTGLLLKSGLTVSDIFPIVSDLTSNVVYKAEVLAISNSVTQGGTISQAMSGNKFLFPPMTVHVISIGEKTGNLSSSFLYLAEYFEQEVDTFTKNLSTIIEPLLMVLMGAIVGFIAISIITPIYGITQNLHP